MSTIEALATAGLPRHEAERLVRLVISGTRADVLGDPNLTEEQRRLFDRLVERRRSGEPLQYIEGRAAFGPIEVAIDARALIPRPETEQLWERALDMAPDGVALRVLDVCTGSGCVALAWKRRRPNDVVVGADLSDAALGLARENAASLGLDVAFRHGDLFDAVAEDDPFDLIIGNPPYVTEHEWIGLPDEIRLHEPRVALVAGPDGLAVVRRLAVEAMGWLREGGRMIVEIGEGQGEAAAGVFEGNGWVVAVSRDLAGRNRFLTASRS